MTAAASVCFIIGALCLLGGVYEIVSCLRMRERATGTVVGTDSSGVQRVPVVTFITPLGRPVRFLGGNDMGFSRVRVGRMVRVRYNARDPGKARIATFYMSFLDPAFITLMGVGLLIVGFLIAGGEVFGVSLTEGVGPSP
jgi:hypothetical protein